MYQRKNKVLSGYDKETAEDKEAAERARDYARQNIVVSQFGQPPPNWYEGKKFCPFSGKKCANFKCMAWHEESPDTGGYCIMIGRFAVNE